MFQLLIVEGMHHVHAVVELGSEQNIPAEHPVVARLRESHLQHWFENLFPLVFGEGGGHGGVLESCHDGGEEAFPRIVGFQSSPRSDRIGPFLGFG